MRAVRNRNCASQPRARLARMLGKDSHAAAGMQYARLRLEQHPREVVAGEGGEQPTGLAGLEALHRDALFAHRTLAGGLPAVVAVREPGEAALDHQAGLDRAPQLAGSVGGPRVPAVRALL